MRAIQGNGNAHQYHSAEKNQCLFCIPDGFQLYELAFRPLYQGK